MPPAWSEYITNVLTESGYVSRAAVVGADGRRWATSATLELSSAEIQAIARGFVEPASLRLDGIFLCGKPYTCTRMDSVVMVGRESAAGSGCIVYRCRNALVIGVYEDGVHPGGCYNMICKVGDYLREQGI
ncbi:profilin-2-like [Saccostrea echinata]|uniref:profilin-2-like n=1 Tax=Saccostrea echinata TaxID=191078 RepID=UPI002A83639D|nr:profilin-2-like [Saccostrea echinata]